MRVPKKHINKKFRAVAILTLWMLILTQVCAAQQHPKRLPDSVSTEVDEIPPPVLDTIVKVDTVARIRDLNADAAGSADTAAAGDTVETDLPDTYRTISDSTVTKRQRDKDFAYANDPAYWAKENVEQEDHWFLIWLAKLLRSNGFKIFFYSLLAAILLYAFYRIISENNLSMFYKRSSTLAAAGPVEEEMAEVDLDERLRQALQNKDHRAATRYLYLKSLRQLEAREWIRYHIQATGQDYVQQMNTRPEGAAFRRLNGIYERVWYGEFPVSDEQFDKVHQYFLEFYSTLGKPA